MKRARWNVYLEDAHAERLEQLALRQGISRSSLLATALSAFLSADGGESREVATAKRLDRLTRQFERLERDQTIQLETLALFIRHQLSVTAAIPEAHLEAARAQGRARFEEFVEHLARHLQRGGSLVRQVWQEITPESKEAAHVSSNGSTA